jgi:hypothetical protein
MATLQTCPKVPGVRPLVSDWGGKKDRRNDQFAWVHALRSSAQSKKQIPEVAWEEARARYETRRRVRAAFDWFSREVSQDLPLAARFRREVEIWKEATAPLSSIAKMVAHPSYLRIIGLARHSIGHELERLLLKELQSEPDHWFDALVAITGEDPTRPDQDFDEAVEAWLQWGRTRGLV